MENAETPAAMVIRLQPIDHTESKNTARRCHPIKVAVFVKGDSRSRPGTIIASIKGINDVLPPGFSRLCKHVHNPTATFTHRPGTPRYGRSVEIALGAERHPFVGLTAVGAT